MKSVCFSYAFNKHIGWPSLWTLWKTRSKWKICVESAVFVAFHMKSTFLGAFHKKHMLFIIVIMSFRVITKYRSFDIRKTKNHYNVYSWRTQVIWQGNENHLFMNEIPQVAHVRYKLLTQIRDVQKGSHLTQKGVKLQDTCRSCCPSYLALFTTPDYTPRPKTLV